MLLFHPKVEAIRSNAREILGCTHTLALLAERSTALEAYDLKASAGDLRDAADKLDEIRAELQKRRAPVLVAAE